MASSKDDHSEALVNKTYKESSNTPISQEVQEETGNIDTKNGLQVTGNQQPGPVKTQPMSPLAASATVINLILATGPFTYPSQFASLGPAFSLIFLFTTCFVSYIASTFIVEVISYANAVQNPARLATLYPDDVYDSPDIRMKFNNKDLGHKTSPYYIRQKIEIGKLAERFCAQWIKIFLMVILVVYMYGAMCLKYASGAESFVQAISFTIYKDAEKWTEISPVDPYYLGIVIFGGLSLLFSFGNIENSKVLQIVTGFLRLMVLSFMYGCTIYSLGKFGVHAGPVFNISEQYTHIANVFGGTVFAFIFHHSISGIVFPIRPQTQIKPMFLTSHVIGASLLGLEGFMSWLAFSSLTNDCKTEFPCKIQDLFNENFVSFPFIGQVTNFYPMLNVSSVPVLTITLRNNVMEIIPIKKWLGKSNNRVARFLLQDQRRIVKGVWSILISIPVIIIVIFFKKPQVFITYTGGICGTFILLIFPVTLVFHARKKNIEQTYGPNFNKSPFKHSAFMIGVLAFGVITLVAVIIGLIINPGNGH